MCAPGARRARARPGLVGRTGGAASRPLPRHKRATLAAGLTGGSHHPSPALRALAPTASCTATQKSAHTPGARPRPWAAPQRPSRPRLAVREAHLGAAPRAGSSAPPRRCADYHARRTRPLRPSSLKAPAGPSAPHGFHRAPLPHGDRQQASPVQPRHLQRRTPGRRARAHQTDNRAFFLVTEVPSRTWPTPAPDHASSSELVCGTSCHRRCCTLLLYSRLRLSNYISDLWS
jgi:hypothetical protein